ncbi:MAG: oxidoreductase [Lachnospiraceae bacterium]|nr:oxidoreductase [Lachnospiraceae bacterium]
MSKGLLIRYDWCTGCKSCEAACRQEHNFPANVYGIKVDEVFLNHGQTFNNIAVPTDLCDMCAERAESGKIPTCAKHCMARVIEYGEIEELARRAEEIDGKVVIWRPKAKPAINPLDGGKPLF